jgi:methyl-accepting chemotaxis protein
MREQREAVNRIAAEIKEMAGISEKSHVQAESLRGMAAELNVSASGLNQLVARFQL